MKYFKATLCGLIMFISIVCIFYFMILKNSNSIMYLASSSKSFILGIIIGLMALIAGFAVFCEVEKTKFCLVKCNCKKCKIKHGVM
jgi:uncharacterized membrane protein